MPKYKAVLFDLWGTLAEITDRDVLVDNVKQILGKDKYDKLIELFIDWHSNSKTKQKFIDELNKAISLNEDELKAVKKFIAPENYRLFPETKEVLNTLKKLGVKIILVTNSPSTSKQAFNSMQLAKFFDKILFSCDLGILKPSKEIFQEALKGFNIQPEGAIMIGDSLEKDVQGAVDAGLNAILLDRSESSHYKNKISNLREIVDKTKN